MVDYLPFDRSMAFYLNKLTHRCFVLSLLCIPPYCIGNYFEWSRWPSFVKTSIPIANARIICVMFCWNWPIFLNVTNFLLPSECGVPVAFDLKKLESSSAMKLSRLVEIILAVIMPFDQKSWAFRWAKTVLLLCTVLDMINYKILNSVQIPWIYCVFSLLFIFLIENQMSFLSPNLALLLKNVLKCFGLCPDMFFVFLWYTSSLHILFYLFKLESPYLSKAYKIHSSKSHQENLCCLQPHGSGSSLKFHSTDKPSQI